MKQKIVIFGLGTNGIWFINEIGTDTINLIIDNTKGKYGEEYNGIEIVTLDQYRQSRREELIVITSSLYRSEMEQQLEQVGIKEYCFYADFWIREKLASKLASNNRKILLMNTHSFNNIGDHAITMAEIEFLCTGSKTFEIVDIPALICGDGMNSLKILIKESDIILISGGGYLGSLWLDYGENNVRNIITNFAKNLIIIMPQTLYFSNDKKGKQEKEITKKIYNGHKQLVICLRDKLSYDIANEMFDPTVKLLYMPDMVLLMQKNRQVTETQHKIICCFRKDKESVLVDKIKDNLIRELIAQGNIVEHMTMEWNCFPKMDERFDAVLDRIDRIQHSKLVITDRLHCMLLSTISGIPCIAFDNLSHKVSGVYRWINEIPYVQMAIKGNSIIKQVNEIETLGKCQYDNTRIKWELNKIWDIIN